MSFKPGLPTPGHRIGHIIANRFPDTYVELRTNERMFRAWIVFSHRENDPPETWSFVIAGSHSDLDGLLARIETARAEASQFVEAPRYLKRYLEGTKT